MVENPEMNCLSLERRLREAMRYPIADEEQGQYGEVDRLISIAGDRLTALALIDIILGEETSRRYEFPESLDPRT